MEKGIEYTERTEENRSLVSLVAYQVVTVADSADELLEEISCLEISRK